MSYLLIVLLLNLLILAHELGHFLAARRLRIPISRFSVGFGPRLWGFRRKGVEYRLAIIPFGGYVLAKVDDEKAYLRIPAGKRILFHLCGPASNLLLAVALLAVYNALSGNLSAHGLLVAPFVQAGQMLLRIVSAVGQMLPATMPSARPSATICPA